MKCIVTWVSSLLNKKVHYFLFGFIIVVSSMTGCFSVNNKEPADPGMNEQLIEIPEKEQTSESDNEFLNGGFDKEAVRDGYFGVDEYTELLFLYDSAIEDYKIFKDFVEGKIPVEESGFSSKYWLEMFSGNGELYMEGVGFFIRDFDNDSKAELGIIALYSDGISTLSVIKEENGKLILGLFDKRIVDTNSKMLTLFYSNGYFYQEEERLCRTGQDCFVPVKSRVLYCFDGADLEYVCFDGEYLNEVNFTLDYSFFESENDSEIVLHGVINSDGSYEYSDEDKKQKEELQKDMERKVESLVLNDHENFDRWEPSLENGAIKVTLNQIIKP